MFPDFSWGEKDDTGHFRNSAALSSQSKWKSASEAHSEISRSSLFLLENFRILLNYVTQDPQCNVPFMFIITR